MVHLLGGCINNVYRIETNQGKFLLKLNNAKKFPAMFEAEAAGLRLLKQHTTLNVPQVILYTDINNHSYLVLEFIETGIRKKDFFSDFGIKLAEMHRVSSDCFGLHINNYMGSLVQTNNQVPDGIAFFRDQRLKPQIDLAVAGNRLSTTIVNDFEKLFKILHNLLPDEQASLIHGDLWSGNFLTAADGTACIYDPAVSYCFRECDIAMTKLFGGFDDEFYEAYNDASALAPGWQQRIDLFNLYPLLVHVNLFGGGYVQQCRLILNQYV